MPARAGSQPGVRAQPGRQRLARRDDRQVPGARGDRV